MSGEEIPLHLRGNGRPVTEELSLTELKVTGSIPEELDGRYVRNGANPISGTSAHPFFRRWNDPRDSVGAMVKLSGTETVMYRLLL